MTWIADNRILQLVSFRIQAQQCDRVRRVGGHTFALCQCDRRIIDRSQRDVDGGHSTGERSIAHGKGETVGRVEISDRIIGRRLISQVRSRSDQRAAPWRSDNVIDQRIAIGISAAQRHRDGSLFCGAHVLIHCHRAAVRDCAHIDRHGARNRIHFAVIGIESKTVQSVVVQRGSIGQVGRNTRQRAVTRRSDDTVGQRIAIGIRCRQRDGNARIRRSGKTLVLRHRGAIAVWKDGNVNRLGHGGERFVVGLEIIITQRIGDPIVVIENRAIDGRDFQFVFAGRVERGGIICRRWHRIEGNSSRTAEFAPDQFRRAHVLIGYVGHQGGLGRRQGERSRTRTRGHALEIQQGRRRRVVFNGRDGGCDFVGDVVQATWATTSDRTIGGKLRDVVLPFVKCGQRVFGGAAVGVLQESERIPIIAMPGLLFQQQTEGNPLFDLELRESVERVVADHIAEHPVGRRALGHGGDDTRRDGQHIRLCEFVFQKAAQIHARHSVGLFQARTQSRIQQGLLVRRVGVVRHGLKQGVCQVTIGNLDRVIPYDHIRICGIGRESSEHGVDL